MLKRKNSTNEMDLAYTLLEDSDTLVLVDAVPRGGQPEFVYLIQPGSHTVQCSEQGARAPGSPPPEFAAALDPVKVVAFCQDIGHSTDTYFACRLRTRRL